MDASAPRSGNSFVPGAIVGGKYRLGARLGEGGIAEVWDALNVDLDAPVAVKVCRPTLGEPSSGQRLIHEAKAAARLMHPSIVRIYDVGLTEKGEPYIVMERLVGRTLRAELDRGRSGNLPLVVNSMVAVLDALVIAHRSGVVHRDVKPENIFLCEVDAQRVQPKLLDFGIVKVSGFSANLTKTGTTLGSPAYMAPEQAAGETDVDARADLWSASVVLFEALLGRTPFDASNYNALMRMIIDEPVPDLVEGLRAQGRLTRFTEAVARVVQRGLEKERLRRWQRAEQLRDALAACISLVEHADEADDHRVTSFHFVNTPASSPAANTLRELSGTYVAVSAQRSARRWPAALLAATLGSAALLAVWAFSGPTGSPPEAASSTPPPLSTVQADLASVSNVAVPNVAVSNVAEADSRVHERSPNGEGPASPTFVQSGGARVAAPGSLGHVASSATSAPTKTPSKGDGRAARNNPAVQQLAADKGSAAATGGSSAMGAGARATPVRQKGKAEERSAQDLGLKEAY